MPTKKRPGMTGVYVEIPDEMNAELEAIAGSLPLGGKADHVRMAIRRHLDNPPRVESTPLPPVPSDPPKPAPKKPKK